MTFHGQSHSLADQLFPPECIVLYGAKPDTGAYWYYDHDGQKQLAVTEDLQTEMNEED
ncbi:MAG: hypothetical protein ACXABY_02515 [Candidatus Thorarchaeota archaeon]|jgi:hypothetical protein